MLQQLENMKEQFLTPLRSAGIVLLFFMAIIVFLWIVMALIRVFVG